MTFSHSPLALAVACLGALAVAGGHARQSPAHQAYPPAAPDIQAFVRAALADRLRANDIPDLNLLQSSQRIGVRDVMPESHLTLLQSALPQVGAYQLFLLAPAEAQASADRRKETIPFITVDRPSLAGDVGTVWLGIDLATPTDPAVVKLCCCAGHAEFRRSGAEWAFVKWSTMRCS